MNKNIISKVILLSLTMFMIVLSTNYYNAATVSQEEAYNVYLKYIDSLNEQQQIQLENWVAAVQFGMYEEYYESWIASKALGSNSKVAEILLNEGYYTEHIEEMKQIGVLRADYELPSKTSSKPSNNVSAVVSPESITTTKCEEKTMWAKSEVNVRENGSTSYKKVASLKKDEQVTVTGIDSTGWYEIRLADGTVGHVSDKYLTEVQPSVNTVSTDAEGKVPEETPAETATPQRQSEIISIDGRTVVWYNAETGREEEVTFSDSTPLDEVEEFANTYLINGAELVESTPEPTVEPMKESENSIEELESPIPSAEPEAEEVQDPAEEVLEKNSSASNFKYAVVGILVLVALASVAGILIYKKKK